MNTLQMPSHLGNTSMQLRRTDTILRPHQSRILFRPFHFGGDERAQRVLQRVSKLTEKKVEKIFAEIMSNFRKQSKQVTEFFQSQFDAVAHSFAAAHFSPQRQLLVGAYCSQEYAFESSALFNPSLVWSPDQSGLSAGSKRFILSLRATGEGHISSITFRTGTIDEKFHIQVDSPTDIIFPPNPVLDSTFKKSLFARKLEELGLFDGLAELVLRQLKDQFTADELHVALNQASETYDGSPAQLKTIAEGIRSLAKANYVIAYPPETDFSERVIFPHSPHEANGIEDSRFVLFTEDDGSQRYVATYTAFNGHVVFPQLVETEDFLRFHVSTLNGPAAKNKGMALFPSKINGNYAMLGRQDGENISLSYSDNLHFWHTSQILVEPEQPWELVQLGNCGSPIQTEHGWLVLTHGVGPIRNYAIGAMLLDLEDPSCVIGRLRDPLLTPIESERRGYVPNVVYSCGGQIHNGHLILPYAMSDYASSFATVPLDRLIDAME